MKRILVTGSRIWKNETFIFAELNRAVRDLHCHIDDIVLVVGGADGADSIAEDIWTEMNGTVEVHKAQWDRYGNSAGYRRNVEMINSGVDLCLAFIKGNSKGATMTADLCQKRGIETRIFRL